MNAEGTKRLALIKSLVREQGADGDKCWLIVQLETEAQALEAGGRIAELEALVRELEKALEAEGHAAGKEGQPHHVICAACAALTRADKALAREPGERGYSAEEVREAFAAGIRYYCLKGGVGAADEALRLYPDPEKPPHEIETKGGETHV